MWYNYIKKDEKKENKKMEQTKPETINELKIILDDYNRLYWAIFGEEQ